MLLLIAVVYVEFFVLVLLTLLVWVTAALCLLSLEFLEVLVAILVGLADVWMLYIVATSLPLTSLSPWKLGGMLVGLFSGMCLSGMLLLAEVISGGER